MRPVHQTATATVSNDEANFILLRPKQNFKKWKKEKSDVKENECHRQFYVKAIENSVWQGKDGEVDLLKRR